MKLFFLNSLNYSLSSFCSHKDFNSKNFLFFLLLLLFFFFYFFTLSLYSYFSPLTYPFNESSLSVYFSTLHIYSLPLERTIITSTTLYRKSENKMAKKKEKKLEKKNSWRNSWVSHSFLSFFLRLILSSLNEFFFSL